TWGIPVLAGRDFDEHDTTDHQNVVLISQSGAKVFGNENPIGFSATKTRSAKRSWSRVPARRARLSASPVTFAREKSTSLTIWNFIVPGRKRTFHSRRL